MIEKLRDFPSVEELTGHQKLSDAVNRLPRPVAVQIIRDNIQSAKTRFRDSKKPVPRTSLLKEIRHDLQLAASREIGRVINATGIVVHTNLGRAPLSETIIEEIKKSAVGFSNVELDVQKGVRGKRGAACEQYLAALSGAESATVVNNCAAGLFLGLSALAYRKEVLLSRGELVQIGGGFRIPDILRKSGAKLVEVGTTNITTLRDYRQAITERTALILKVHKSNFVQAGFTQEVSLPDLVVLGREHSLPVFNDLGSGVFVDTRRLLGYHEPTVQQSVKAGADLTCFSGDKMLGGSQAGLLVGGRIYIEKIKRNPIFRTVRVDKITLSILEKLLRTYLDGTYAQNIPLWSLMTVPESELYRRGKKLLARLGNLEGLSVQATQVYIGGGALPQSEIPSVGLVFAPERKASVLFRKFLQNSPPVLGHITEDSFVLDLKAVPESDLPILSECIRRVLADAEDGPGAP
jgi:L-seryl-tRNA(Ser) seleniumtransferase